jgi:hypothetical protein
MEEKDQIYQSAVSEIEHIIALIDEERPPGGK